MSSTRSDQAEPIQPNAQRHYRVTRADLPLHCPMPGMSRWNSHPRVFLAIEQEGESRCPYCGAIYTLVNSAEGTRPSA